MEIKDGEYRAFPTSAAIYQNKTGNLILAVRFQLCDEKRDGYVKENGYALDYTKYFVLVKSDGSLNTKIIDGICKWAAGFEPTSLEAFYDYFTGANMENLRNLDVKVTLKTEAGQDGKMRQGIAFVNSLDHVGGGGNMMPKDAVDDRRAIAAKFGAKFRAAFGGAKLAPASKPVAEAASGRPQPPAHPAVDEENIPAAPAAPAAPQRPAPKPPMPATAPKPPATCESAYTAYLNSLPPDTPQDASDQGWWQLLDAAGVGQKDQDQITPAEWQHVTDLVAVPF